MPSVQDKVSAQTSSLGERLKELQTSQERSAAQTSQERSADQTNQERSVAQVLKFQVALKDCVEGERARGTRGKKHQIQGFMELKTLLLRIRHQANQY